MISVITLTRNELKENDLYHSKCLFIEKESANYLDKSKPKNPI